MADKKRNEGWLNSWPSLIIFCLVLPLLFRSLFYAPFHIPSGSMKSTLLVGDFLFVYKNSYGYSKYSFPFAVPLWDNRNNSAEPKRGDVVVFRPPPTPHIDYIKRVIGLPGDRVQMKNSLLYLNDKLVERKQVDDFVDTDSHHLKRYLQTLPNGVSFYILDDFTDSWLDNTAVYTVPDGHYFMMGDNRDHSADSRTKTVGFVPRENLVGRAEVVVMSSKNPLWQFWKWFDGFRGDRFLKSIQL